jgi:hypothetical protein
VLDPLLYPPIALLEPPRLLVVVEGRPREAELPVFPVLGRVLAPP